MRFVAEQAGGPWAGYEWLAGLCEGAGLWPIQAEAARGIVAGVPVRQLSGWLCECMGETVSAKRARYQACQAGILLRRYRRDLAADHRGEARQLIVCVRNVRPVNPGIQVYRERWGVIDREPVRFHSRLVGELPEDLTHPIRFLRDLGRLYQQAVHGASAGPGG